MSQVSFTAIIDAINGSCSIKDKVELRNKDLIVNGYIPTAIIFKIADQEPLFRTDQVIGESRFHDLVRAVKALVEITSSIPFILAVREDWIRCKAVLRKAMQGIPIEIYSVPASYPLDPCSLKLDIAQVANSTIDQMKLRNALILDATTLCDIATALDGRPITKRIISLVGAVNEPKVLSVPLGTSIEDMVKACGDSKSLGWFAFHNGLLGGHVVDNGYTVDRHTRGVVILPREHPWVIQQTTPLEDEFLRCASACINCRVCTDLCPVVLNGSSFEPHLILKELTTRWSESEDKHKRTAILSALHCTQCGLCNVVCPSSIRPADLIRSIIDEFKEEGIGKAVKTEQQEFSPLPDRSGRRISISRLVVMLGLGQWDFSSLPDTK